MSRFLGSRIRGGLADLDSMGIGKFFGRNLGDKMADRGAIRRVGGDFSSGVTLLSCCGLQCQLTRLGIGLVSSGSSVYRG